MHFYLTFSIDYPFPGAWYAIKISKEAADSLKVGDSVNLKSFIYSHNIPKLVSGIKTKTLSQDEIAEQLSDFDMIVAYRRLEMVGGIETLYINLKDYEPDKE